MSSEERTEPVDRMSPDPFGLAREIRKRIEGCTHAQCACASESPGVRYLWVYSGTEPDTPPQMRTAEAWINVVDEAASLGVEWLVVSLQSGAVRFPCVWDLLAWAQQTYRMNVAIHVNDYVFSEGDLERLHALESALTSLFVPKDKAGLFGDEARRGICIHSCGPRPSGVERCSMPGSMLFVNTDGRLYTCGMVNGEASFVLGDIHAGFFEAIMHDEAKPHAVEKSAMKRENGCAGCPPLVLHAGH